MRRLIIDTLGDGFSLKEYELQENGRFQFVSAQAFEELPAEDIKDGEIAACQRLLYSVLDRLGPSTSRYSEERLYVKVEPGDKFNDGKESDALENHDDSIFYTGLKNDR